MKLISLIAVLTIILMAHPANASETANRVIEAAKKSCALQKGQFTAPEISTTNVDLNADGKPDEIIDESKFACSTSSSLYCGTGGCMLHLIVDGKDYKRLAKEWVIAQLGEAKIFIIGIHWSECSYKSPCLRAITWRDGRFRSLK
jgi:hypothetical protein